MENIQIIIIALICLLLGGYEFWKKRKQLKAMKERDMLWATTWNVFLSAILLIGIGISIIVYFLIKFL